MAAWNAVAFLAIILIPSQIRFGTPFWSLPALQVVQGWIWGATFLLFAMFLAIAARREDGIRLAVAIAIGLGSWGVGSAALVFQSAIPYSRLLALLAASLGSALAILPYYLGRLHSAATTALTATVLLVSLLGVRSVEIARDSQGSVTQRLPTALHTVSMTTFPNVVDSAEMDGGAIEPFGDGYLLLTGEGEFYRLDWDSGGTALRSVRLTLSVPLGRAEYLEQQRGAPWIPRLRVTDFVLDTNSTPALVYVAHQSWNSRGRCFTMRVSVAPFTPDAAIAPWKSVFESAPCLPVSDTFDDIETGGRLAWYDGRSLLLSVGDHGLREVLRGRNPSVSYGKILRLDTSGRARVLSRGHRNPQGLEVDREGRIWSTEHGPQGGDEINIIEPGGNYGWPLVTYGTQYGLDYWPVGPGGRDHGRFIEPVYAFVPSVGVSNLIQIGGRAFPSWDGDFLVATLRGRTLFRMRTRDRRVIYLEPMSIDRRIRDLAEGQDGRVLLWTGRRDVLVLSRAEESVGARAYNACSSCHGADLGGTALGPSLRHVYDRPIGTREGFTYSPALKGLGGAWDDARLDAFLRHPQGYAPGTTMKFPGIPDASVRSALIAYLHLNL